VQRWPPRSTEVCRGWSLPCCKASAQIPRKPWFVPDTLGGLGLALRTLPHLRGALATPTAALGGGTHTLHPSARQGEILSNTGKLQCSTKDLLQTMPAPPSSFSCSSPCFPLWLFLRPFCHCSSPSEGMHSAGKAASTPSRQTTATLYWLAAICYQLLARVPSHKGQLSCTFTREGSVASLP